MNTKKDEAEIPRLHVSVPAALPGCRHLVHGVFVREDDLQRGM